MRWAISWLLTVLIYLGYVEGVKPVGSSTKQAVLNALRKSFNFVSASLIFSLHPTRCNANIINTTPSNIALIFAPGFLIESEFYTSYFDVLQPIQFYSVPLSNSSLIDDAELMVSQAVRFYNDSNGPDSGVGGETLVLMGHSRGGAVAAMAASTILQHHLIPSKKVYLILLDPVDTADHIATSSLAQLGGNKNENSISLNTLLLSTPYGGSSGYYNVKYDSVCAPVGRNADSFYIALQSHSNSDTNNDGDSITFVTLPQIGHLQLLNKRVKSTISSVCASSNKISDDTVKSFIQTLIFSWIQLYTIPEKFNNNDIGSNDDITTILTEGKLSKRDNINVKLKNKMISFFSSIISEWI